MSEKKRGRPPMAAEQRKRNNLTFRLRDALKEQVELAAAGNGRSMSEEIEYRLEESFQGAAVGECVHCGTRFVTGPQTGKRSHRKYCSDAHRVAAMRKRQAAADSLELAVAG